jgi:biotin carboxyl carrier protein
MLHATINNNTYDIEWNKDLKGGTLNGSPFAVDRIEIGGAHSHILFNNRSYSIEVVSLDKDSKVATIMVNGSKYTVQLKDRFDDLLKSLGMESAGTAKLKELKAPMPGLVLNILVEDGQSVEKDTPLLILEAMKMENVIKSPAAGTVKRIAAIKGQAVEKSAILIEFA